MVFYKDELAPKAIDKKARKDLEKCHMA